MDKTYAPIENKPHEKIKVESIDIVVTGPKEKPYYSIKYRKVGSNDDCIGYGSYSLEYVLGWKEQCFELVERKSGWIPCSERLPEKNKLVLGWYKDNPFSGYTYGIVMKTKMGWVFDYGNRYCSNVAAWMPLPEPYREVTDEENLESRR